MDARVSVIIPARNAAATLPATLAGLEHQDGPGPFEVIVVDDGSGDATRALAAASQVVTRVLDGGGGGPAAARNAGVAAASGELLAFLDADCCPGPGWLRAGVAALARADLVLGEVRPDPDAPLGPFDRTLWVLGRSPLFESANLFVRRELFEALHGFESWLGPRGGKELGEDVWFGWRAVRAGARIEACPDALVHHAVFPRGPLGYASERWRLRFFPALARRVPELRGALFHHRVFLTPRSEAFAVAVLAWTVAAAAGSGVRRDGDPARVPLAGTIALAGSFPYGRHVYDDAREARRRRLGRRGSAELIAARIAADAVGAAALAYGSVRSRTPLI